MSTQITSPDLPGILSRLVQLPEAMRREVRISLNEELLQVLADSKRKPPRVPVDTGALQSTGYVEPAKIEGAKVSSSIGYGGVASFPFNKTVDYAQIVHDNLNGRIKNYKRPGSGPKFLETHLNAHKPIMTEKFEKALGKGSRSLFS